MTPRTWQRIKEVYSEASELPVEERRSFVTEVAGEARIAGEVFRLLELDEEADRRLKPLQVPSGLLVSASERRAFRVGERVGERYEIRRFLAEGGMGEVYEADDLERGERIAIKAIRPEFAQAAQLSWLRREVEAARRIQHPNVCRVYELVQVDKHTFLTMELLEGETLAAALERQGSLSERQALPWLRQILAGLAAAHRAGVVHRDLKPGNVMIVPRVNGAPRVVLMDFGLARHTAMEAKATMASQTVGVGIGTPAYMAPEQIEGRKSTAATDIYSFGILLFEMLTGQVPFAAESPLAMAVKKAKEEAPSPLVYNPALRRQWVSVIQKCLARRPGDRFATVENILPALETRSTNRWRVQRLLRRVRRVVQSRPVWTVGVLAALVVVALAWRLWPRAASAAVLEEADRGVLSLQADEPVAALGHLERAAGAQGAPWRTTVDLALAWHAMGMTERAQDVLASARTMWASEADQQYLAAARAVVTGQMPQAVGILTERAKKAPADARVLADLAWVAQGPLERWREVARLRPDHAAAQLHVAEAAARDGKWREADGAYAAAQTWFLGQGNPRLEKAVAARRGLRRLENGDVEMARQDLASFAALPIPAGAGVCEHVVVLQAGAKDEFAQPADDVPMVSPRFQMLPDVASGRKPRQFDEPAANQQIYFSVPLPPVRICSAKVELRIRRGLEWEGAANDVMHLGAVPFTDSQGPGETISLWAEAPSANERTLSIELNAETFAKIQRVYAGQPQALLDVLLGDDTTIDYFKITLFY